MSTASRCFPSSTKQNPVCPILPIWATIMMAQLVHNPFLYHRWATSCSSTVSILSLMVRRMSDGKTLLLVLFALVQYLINCSIGTFPQTASRVKYENEEKMLCCTYSPISLRVPSVATPLEDRRKLSTSQLFPI